MFSPKFTLTVEIAKALMHIEAARQAVSGLPINVRLLAELRESAALHSAHFSTQIEGNRLTLPEVQAVAGGARLPGRERDQTEIRNHYRAFALLEKRADETGPLQETDFKRLHALVLSGVDRPSPYRDIQNVIRESSSGRIVYLPPEAKDVPVLMGELLAWINRELAADNLPVPVVAALSHYQYATIHPFVDGNGRTARLITTLILRRSGYGLKGIYSLDEHYATHLAGYYNALGVGHHNYYEGRVEGDVTPLLAYFCNGMAEAFASVRAAAARSASHAEPDRAETLRRLDPRLRRLLPLFEAHGAVTSAEMAHVLFMAPGTLVRLCRQWVTDGVLEVQDLSRKNRSYRLGRTLRGPEFDWKIRS